MHTGFIIAATPRSGSNLLCEGLRATGVAGVPTEPYAPDFRWMLCAQWGLSPSVDMRTYVDVALDRGTTPNGVTGFKIQWMHVDGLARALGLADGDVLAALLPGACFVNIVRGDRLAQALSWYRAIATGEWWRFDGGEGPPAPPLRAAEVRYLQWHLEAQQAAWAHYFAGRGVAPLTVRYESLVADYRGEIARVLRFLGLDDSAAMDIPAPRHSRQADAVSTEWKRQLTTSVVAA